MLKPRMAKGHSPVGGYPVALSVGSAMVKAPVARSIVAGAMGA